MDGTDSCVHGGGTVDMPTYLEIIRSAIRKQSCGTGIATLPYLMIDHVKSRAQLITVSAIAEI